MFFNKDAFLNFLKFQIKYKECSGCLQDNSYISRVSNRRAWQGLFEGYGKMWVKIFDNEGV